MTTIVRSIDIEATDISNAMTEIEAKFGITGDLCEVIATHIVITDTDWIAESL